MSLRLRAAMMVVGCLGLMAPMPVARAGDGARGGEGAKEMDVADWDGLKGLLKASDEEWSVIYPQLGRIWSIREDLYGARTYRPSSLMLEGTLAPMGGTSLSAPEMPKRGGDGGGGRRQPEAPFDPKNAPGTPAVGSGLSGVLRGIAIRAMVAAILPDQGHPVQAVLYELDTLMKSREATEEQIRDKLAMVRAVRAKAVRDLEAAQKAIVPFLTVEQAAVLVDLGILD